MIISSAKPFEEILKLLENEDDIFVIGCNVCAAKLHVGGEPEVLEMCERLESAGKNVIGWALPTAACSISSREHLVEKNEAIKDARAILVMACGCGTSVVAKVVDVPVYSSNNTTSLGGSYKGEVHHKLCAMCGDCTIVEFGGICPTTQCPKNLLNGPCGGSMNGKCEVDREKDCAWELIYERLKKIDRLDLLERLHEPKNHSK
ncbi:MAG: methylenetetrahydrofolate reductase C-terminal domain-containing protein [Methanosarcinaceae archaeon]|nr:methylenetetrahydrofolate reductase C-terminal domain-containing protein [Methanosarcinaceae archaeon]